MNCHDVETGELLERHIQGALSEDERDAVEEHVLGCARCADDLATLLAVRTELERTAMAPAGRRPWIPIAAAAGLLIVLATAWLALRRPGVPGTESAGASPAPEPTPDLTELARIDPPSYEETVLRGTAEPWATEFRDAMRLYQRGAYGEALPGLERAAELAPQAPQVRFFLGASYLLARRFEPAVDALRVSAQDADSPFAEEARFYLAKAYLGAGRIDEARSELEPLATSAGAWAEDARALLARL